MKDSDAAPAEALFEEEGRAGIVTLNRPAALNALSLGMIRGLEAHHLKWAKAPKIYGVLLQGVGKAFCTGGDVKAVYQALQAGDLQGAIQFFREEYQHCWTLECFTKPNVALINGLMMGGGAGICLYGTHRVAAENFSFAMPETAIGFFPDIGASYFLPRLPGEIGLYLGLTGARIGRADACTLGIATHAIDAADFAKIRAALVESDPIDPVLDALHRDPGSGELLMLQPAIDRIFGAESVEEILARLDAETGVHSAWARSTAATLRRRSPLSLKLTFRLIRQGRAFKTLKEALAVEFRLAVRCLEGHDFREGIRSALIDRDQSPNWQHKAIGDVREAEIDAYFAPLAIPVLELKDHWTLVE